ncbi:M43 family zinc metalloprotease [Mangrovivirga sp. M17]|uniref:M43 family zinc metalloprotease n=1 Tax=Mangrovivirga halotolerans TaxID=2993936 RepID=A0ABT3RLB5_9BACT|nr:M43 family zinc metalloprotease [Mangrovivirga halotolerans]MCX2742251.1 M43 family zinc metalloprotease [Mangrovivirga halotolerans]
MIRFNFLALLIIILIQFRAFPQEKCGTVLLSKQKYGDSYQKKVLNFERWLNKKESESNKIFNFNEGNVVQIPVVIHIVHNGEQLGVETNIPQEQILNQLETLNEDFRRMNADSVFTRSFFKPFAADTQIEFVLAKQDPNGLPTTGIVRTQGPQNSYSLSQSDEFELKSSSYWPAEDYLNIWVADLSFTLIGYAQFPVSDLPGLEIAPDNRLTDGVAIDYEYFGTGFNTVPSSKGRTLTHEIGHFFGLRHIWGDGSCDASDYVADTPNQLTSTNGCPEISFTCESEDMFENYMDYTRDECMNIFTRDQSSRMHIVLNESPRRASLLTSPGLIPPEEYNNDLRIGDILYPGLIHSDEILTPEFEIINAGKTAVEDFTIDIIGGSNRITLTPTSPIPAGESVIVSGADLTLLESENFKQEILVKINFSEDENLSDNTKNKTFYYHPFQLVVPFRERFEGPTNWLNIDEENQLKWQYTNSVFSPSGESCIVGTFDNIFETIGNPIIITPEFDLSETNEASVFIDVSYRPASGTITDILNILLSTNGGESFDVNLATISASTLNSEPFRGSWQPSSISDWTRVFIDLTDYAGEKNLRMAFQGINNGSNNFYFDNIELFLSNNPEPLFLNEPDVRVYPNPSIDYTNISFYLDKIQDLNIRLINSRGQILEENRIENVLNQNYRQDLRNLSSGIYFIQIQGETFTTTKRILRQ